MKGLLTKDYLTIKKKYGAARLFMDLAIIIALMMVLEGAGAMHIMISLIICFGVFYLPEWYRILAIMASVSAAYEFCYIMHRTDIKLFPYGFIDHYNFLTILKRKWPVYSLVCLFIMLPLIFVLRIWSWIIPGMSILISLIGILKSFVKPILKRKSLPM